MKNYNLTMEDGVITGVEDTDANGNHIPGVLYIPKEAVDFSADAWVHLGCEADGIVVHKDTAIGARAFLLLFVECIVVVRSVNSIGSRLQGRFWECHRYIIALGKKIAAIGRIDILRVYITAVIVHPLYCSVGIEKHITVFAP